METTRPRTEIERLAHSLVRDRGILAADESEEIMRIRLETVGLESTRESRRDYREMLFGTSGLSSYIRGVILEDATLRDVADDGTALRTLLESAGLIPGIKIDAGTKDLEGCPGERITFGLDGLRERLREYSLLGVKFAKWRAVISVGRDGPSAACLGANAQALAQYAAMCVSEQILPIVEPEVLMEGAHGIDACSQATSRLLTAVFDALRDRGVSSSHVLLKANMIVSGNQCPQQARPREVAGQTVACLRATVPEDVAGIVFLSGGQSAQTATANLNMMNAMFGSTVPWRLSFAFGRALQETVPEAWGGKPHNVRAGQRALLHRARCSYAALNGDYSAELEADNA